MGSWWRRLVNGDVEHQHEPLPVDEFDEEGFRPPRYAQPVDNTPGWIRWLFNGGQDPMGPPVGGYRPAGNHDTELQSRDDEQAQIDAAIRASLQEEALREELHNDDFALRKAMEASKKEAEEEAAKRGAELAIVPAPPPPPPPVELPDLLGLDPLPADLLGPDPNDTKDLMLLQDEALARTLQQQMNLMDDDGVGKGQHDMLSTVTGGERSGGVALAPGAMGLPAGWDTPLPPPPSKEGPAFLALPAPSGSSSTSYNPMAIALICGGCRQPISVGRFLNCLGSAWHPQCFRCKACNQPIVDKEFNTMGADPYHSECHRNLFHPKCVVCDQYIPTKPGGIIEYRSMPFWGDQYCPEHDADNTARCTSCQRLEKRDTPYVDLDDGRKLCLFCIEDVVIDTKECHPLYLSILHFYEELGMKIAQEIPLLCVETQALNAAREGEQQQGHHHSETKGLCLAEEQVIQTVVRLPGMPMSGFRVGQQTQKLKRHCEVTAILVLYGLPQMLTGSILAHELMHAYLKLNGKFPSLEPDVEEGICQVMAHLWLQSQLAAQKSGGASSSSGPQDPTRAYREKFTEFCLHQIATDPSPVYGEGFRKANAAVSQLGLKQTLDHIQLTGTFPEI